MRAKICTGVAVLASVLALSCPALADTFGADSLIIPMDTTYQDNGMFLAYGLVYTLLQNNIPVYWTIRAGKTHLGVDFTASAVNVKTGGVITSHGYRGGPWVVNPSFKTQALSIINPWITAHPTTVVHRATAPFDADVARKLVVAPNIAMFADGNQKIARKYMAAAQIPDSTGNLLWPDTSPDMLTPLEVAGPTTVNHSDGALFDADGDPVYCQLMSMHWGVADARDVGKKGPEVVAEVRSYLGHPVHFFAECQAVNAYENDLVNGLFLTTQGFIIGNAKDSFVDYYHDDSPFAQIDGQYQSVGGSEPSYTLPVGQSYKASDVVMLTKAGTPVGKDDIWMTGFLDGACDPLEQSCGSLGKVSYLGGHEYTTTLPLSTNSQSWGTKVFLNSLFEAPCATEGGKPVLSIEKLGPTATATSNVTYTIDVLNEGPTVALQAKVEDTIPAGTSFVTASGGGTFASGKVTWNLGNLGVGEGTSVDVTITLPSFGSYANTANLLYRVGLNSFSLASNQAVTDYDQDTDGDGVIDSIDTCPNDYNPGQDLQTDPDGCGTCGTVCVVADGTPACDAGTCVVSGCDGGFDDCDGLYGNGCEYDAAGFADDESNCGGCGLLCDPQDAAGECVGGNCTIQACDLGFADCDTLAADGCEYVEAGYATDPTHCGNCTTACGPTETCISSACVPDPCAPGTASCSPPPGTCETTTSTDEANCGGCGIACSPPHATGLCAGGVCAIDTCNGGYADCDGLVGNGCEYSTANFATDEFNCGACGALCDPPSSAASCIAGDCVVTLCAGGFLNCDGDGWTGCEEPVGALATDEANCGACGSVCDPPNAAGECLGGACGVGACDPGFIDADGVAANGCETACTSVAADDTTCDAIDDDCDGSADEDYSPTGCGVGACASSGACVAGTPSCVPGSPSAEASAAACFDGADNDCDGDSDGDDADCDPFVTVDAGTSDSAADAPSDGSDAGTTSDAPGGNEDGAGGAAGAADDAASAAGGSNDASAAGAAGTAGSTGSGVDEDAGAGAATGSGNDGASSSESDGRSGGDGDGALRSPDAADASGSGAADAGDPGGCGCRTGAPARDPHWALAFIVLTLAAGGRRRRRLSDERRGSRGGAADAG